MVDQKELFGRDLHTDRLTKSQFERILRKGFDPAYLLKVQPDDRVTIAERPMSVARAHPKEFRQAVKDSKTNETGLEAVWGRATVRHCIVLSKSRLDQDRRIVAQTDGSDKQWLIGLYVGLLRRQVKEGTRDVKAWAFETLLDLERTDVGFVNSTTLDNWTRDLITKDNDVENMKNVKKWKKGVKP